ncbi:MAG: hypothetical protein A2710_15900 [Burkholderiales bacterium RIFCSPHIGHO2_01_FULL_64_960]|nr:MAG: hypothetical protein A2710_15900 [Burkholderiales bacterium RIFCSPHIGHO2_01_FULL_64_960]
MHFVHRVMKLYVPTILASQACESSQPIQNDRCSSLTRCIGTQVHRNGIYKICVRQEFVKLIAQIGANAI